MKKAKSLIALMLVAVLVLMCTACSSSNNSSSTNDAGKVKATTSGKQDNSMTVALTDQVSTLDPQLFLRSAEDMVLIQIYEPLFYIDNDGNIIDTVLESMTENEDGSVDFVLRDNVKFHSGDVLKSEDVEYTLSRCQNSSISSTLYTAVEMTVTDDTHFTWTFPMADQGMTFETLKPYILGTCLVNKSYCETIISDPNDDLGLNCDGTGPYTFVEKNGNNDITLKRFDDYYDKASIETIYLKYITGSTETAFEAGDIDWSIYSATNFKLLDQYSNVEKESYTVNGVTFMINNCVEGQPTSDLRVRQAIAYCLNREDVTAIGSNDAGTPAYNIANPLVNDYADVADHFEQDIEKANSLMVDAGYSESNKLPLTLIVYSAQPSWVSACEVMKEELEQSYFDITIEQVADTSRYFTYDFDLAVISVALTTQFNSYAALYDTSMGLNISGIEDENVMDAFSAMTDEAGVQNAMKVATESLAYIPLFYNTYFYAYDSDLNHGPLYHEFSGFLFRDFSWKE